VFKRIPPQPPTYATIDFDPNNPTGVHDADLKQGLKARKVKSRDVYGTSK